MTRDVPPNDTHALGTKGIWAVRLLDELAIENLRQVLQGDRPIRLPDVLLMEDLARSFGVANSTAHGLLQQGAFGPAVRVGKRWVVLRSTLLAHLGASARMPESSGTARPTQQADDAPRPRGRTARLLTSDGSRKRT